MITTKNAWPTLEWNEWRDTATTLHMWTQIVGKVRLELTPLQNHWWNVPLYVSSRGLTTSLIPYGSEAFEVEFDFNEHVLEIRTSWAAAVRLKLRPQSVAAFYAEFLDALAALTIDVTLYDKPVEISAPIPFPEDYAHASYNADAAHRFWRILVSVDAVLKQFRAQFIGKSSPVHFFWGSFDLAATRFSGRAAPEKPGVDEVTREAYSHEVISAGFWPGTDAFPNPAFYCYAAPSLARLDEELVRPAAAYWDKNLGEFILKYDDIRAAESPETLLMEFLDSTYEAAARLGKWDRAALERHPKV